jgi:hypothetical protein
MASSLAASLLDHGVLSPGGPGGSSTRLPPSMELIVVKDSMAQTSVSFFHELIARSNARYVK